MSYFDACEACGQSKYLVVEGLCFECQQKATRAAHGSSTLPRLSGIVMREGRVQTHLAPRNWQALPIESVSVRDWLKHLKSKLFGR